MDELLNLIGTSEGAERPFDEWVVAARNAGLQPNLIQRLKRLNVVYTYINADGVNTIVRGARPA